MAVGESNQRWCSDGFGFSCDNGEKLRVTFALDCCDREALYWAASNGGYDSETVQDVMLGAVERRFGNSLPTSPVEWLTDNGSAYRSYQTRQFARMVSKRAHTGKVAVGESNQRWCSDGFGFSCDNGEKLRVTFALDCCDREALYWAASNGGYDSETVQDVMLGAVERRFGNSLPTSPVEWLTDNGSAYRSYQTRQFARMVGLEPKHTAVRSPESNGMAESFVKTMKRDYISIMPKPDGLTAVKNLAEAFEHYNEWHPHSALGYRSPREYLRRRTSNGLSDKKGMEI
ncbi:DDE-type integrase/transposase/recombinase [Klebsiella pneumoniae]|uniref:DDE-type integrase/transposase/recombinase n=1 Tax=Klebsiella pneumoniae TaxID=573 RepID=UPI003F666B6D